MQEDRGDIGHGFVKRGHIPVGPVQEPRSDPVDQGVGDFVGDDVARERSEDELAGDVLARVIGVCLEVPEEHRPQLWIVVRVFPSECMGIEA